MPPFPPVLQLARLSTELQRLAKEEITGQIAMEISKQDVNIAEWEVIKWDHQAALYAEEAAELS